MKYYIIAGEASGDLHGSNLIKALIQQDSNAEFRVWGGDKMAATGASLASHYNELSFMGFVGLIGNLFLVIRKISYCKKDIAAFKPDALVFIDFSGFNLRISKWAKSHPCKKFYYISPQVWASRASRIKTIKATIDKMFCILPFEKTFYAKHGFDVEYVGHPLLDEIKKFKPTSNFYQFNGLDERPIIALMPGSRKQEISSTLAVLLKLVPQFPEFQFVIAGAPSIDSELYQKIINANLKKPSVKVIYNSTYDILHVAHAALVTSGTATLETALFSVPQIVVYKGSAINYWIARRIIKVPYISLVNLIGDGEIVKELIQEDLNLENLASELKAITSSSKRDEQLKNYETLSMQLGGPGAALKTAQGIVEELLKS